MRCIESPSGFTYTYHEHMFLFGDGISAVNIGLQIIQWTKTLFGGKQMQIVLANHGMISKLCAFFGKYVDLTNDGVYSKEFICPDGVTAAAQRRQIMVAMDEGQIVAACRFYKMKTNTVSLYQFAVQEKYRGKGILLKMLKRTEASQVVVRCPEHSKFNQYYRKTGWSLDKENNGFMHWGYSFHGS